MMVTFSENLCGANNYQMFSSLGCLKSLAEVMCAG